jgi:RNA polymerase-binding transcription factor DksA
VEEKKKPMKLVTKTEKERDKKPTEKPVSVRGRAKKTAKEAEKAKAAPEEKKEIIIKKSPYGAVFLGKQKSRLLELRDNLVDSLTGMANDTLRSPAQDGAASAFGMHQADAGSDAYDRDFTLSLLSQEQDAIHEITHALKRIDKGVYGVCEMSGEVIPQERLEVRPYARYTVHCQEIAEREMSRGGFRGGMKSLFGLGDSEDDEDEDEENDSLENEKD